MRLTKSNTVNRKKYDEYGEKLATCRDQLKSQTKAHQGSGQQGGFGGLVVVAITRFF
jgi:hypothetical protein